MYKITVQTLSGAEKNIYYPGNSDYNLASGVLKLKVGSAGELNITIPLSNPSYGEIVEKSILTLYEDGDEIWRGDIRDVKKRFNKSLEVYALEDLAWLGDETVNMTAITNQTYDQRFENALNAYNSVQAVKRRFTKGMLTSVTGSSTCSWKPEWGDTLLDCFRKFIADDGYLKIRRVTNNGVVARYLDIVRLEDYGAQAEQTIAFGQNLLDFVKEIDTTNFVNALYPYGEETDTTLYDNTMARIAGTPIQNDDSIAAFGRHARTVIFETSSLATLNRLAAAYLTRYSQPKLKISAKAIDLGNIEEVNRFRIGDSVRIVAHAFGVDQRDYITKQELDLLNIANNKIEMSESVQTNSLTSQVASIAADLNEAPSESSILKAAKDNALAILDGSNGGNIYFKLNSAGQMVEQGFTNNLDLDQATVINRWNINGRAILTRTSPSAAWTVKVAETINGEIVADFITTGTMLADRIRGGTLELGGISNQKGLLNIYDSSGYKTGYVDNQGFFYKSYESHSNYKSCVYTDLQNYHARICFGQIYQSYENRSNVNKIARISYEYSSLESAWGMHILSPDFIDIVSGNGSGASIHLNSNGDLELMGEVRVADGYTGTFYLESSGGGTTTLVFRNGILI